jgi:predicted DsbA family dithiol-disulfide isomerase
LSGAHAFFRAAIQPTKEFSRIMYVDIFQDTVCPWCRVGKKHLADALAQWDGETVNVRYHPFLLHPGMPEEGANFRRHMTAIKGDANIEPMLQRVCDAGAACEVNFNWDKVQKAPNTLMSHCLIALAPPERQGEVVDAIHAAYFEEGRDIGDRDVLLDIAREQKLGIDRAELAEALDDETLRARIAGEADWARKQGITGVPFFVINETYAISGAQPAATLLNAIGHAAKEVAAAGAPVG